MKSETYVVVSDARLYEAFVFCWTGMEGEWAFGDGGIECGELEGKGGAALYFSEVETLGKWSIGATE